MICSDCQHAIFRTIKNGMEESTSGKCDVDGMVILRQLVGCDRKVSRETEGDRALNMILGKPGEVIPVDHLLETPKRRGRPPRK